MKIRYFTIPNILTLCNLLCGCLAVYYSFATGNLKIVFWLCALAALFDFFDGFAARMLKSYSPLGKELDSLADMVSFGVAPSASLMVLYLDAGGTQPYGLLAYIIALFSALRLARFNIDDKQNDEFIGLPTPANALFVTSLGYVCYDNILSVSPEWFLITGIILACMLIVPVRMFSLKFKTFSLRQNILRYTFLLTALAGICIFGVMAIPALITLYILISVIRHLMLIKD